MAAKVVSTFGHKWKVRKLNIGIVALLLVFVPLSQVSGVEDSLIPSSQQNRKTNLASNISIKISESVKDTRTLNKNNIIEEFADTTEDRILITSTDFIESSSYRKTETSGTNNQRLDKKYYKENSKTYHDNDEQKNTDENDIRKSDFRDSGAKKSFENSDDYYEVIKPTKTVNIQEQKIYQTKNTFSGEVKGVSINQSRPREILEKRIYKDNSEFDPTPIAIKDPKVFLSKFYDENLPKYPKTERFGKNYNQIEQTLGKIAKIALDERKSKHPATPKIFSNNFRESRDEENRKASPDIQDIITGIVKILNGKANVNHAEGSTVRSPRPTSTRINNRGPPRISDVPPLDFDTPPSLVPIPPPPPKRIPAPYPFDVSVSMPNIPLPPQPHKPTHSNLPSHPFIDGVPIPERVIPGEHKLPNPVISEYDTISVSVPQMGTSEKFPPLTVNVLENNRTKPKNTTLASNPEITPASETHFLTVASVSHPNRSETTKDPAITNEQDFKNKMSTQKLTTNFKYSNKTNNKRIRPRPIYRPRPTNGTRTESKPIQMKNVTEITSPTTETNKDIPSESENVLHSVTNDLKKEENFAAAEVKKISAQNLTVSEEKLNESKIDVAADDSMGQDIGNIFHTENPPNEIPAVEHSNLAGYPVPSNADNLPHLESSVSELTPTTTENIQRSTPMLSSLPPLTTVESSHDYKVRPGIVLDDPEYKPVGHKHPILSTRPVITVPPSHEHYGEIFDITVHAVQGPGGEQVTTGDSLSFAYPVELEDGILLQNHKISNGEISVITKPEEGQDFVSIDGKRTYINLFGESTTKAIPTTTQPPSITGTGYVIPHNEAPIHQPSNNRPTPTTLPSRRPYKRPSHPPVRIDTCIVGDDSTCDSAQNEICKTEDGVSSCHCRPGYNRRKHRDTCRRVVSMLTSLRVDKLYDRKVIWKEELRDPDSEEYRQLSYEAGQAIQSAMSMTPFSDDFINSKTNSIYSRKNAETNEPAVYINMTIQLEENLDTIRPAVRHDIQRHLLRVIQRRNNNVGNSAIWVDSPPGSILALQDVDECSSTELHDCSQRATCSNTFGSFKCRCPEGSRDPWVGNIHREGRHCETCSSEFCNKRGECRFEQGQQTCHCTGSFYGAQCEVDGEVLGVAIGASVAAAIIIILTLVCLCMWSRKWSREQKSAVGAGMGSPVFGYMATGPTVKTPNVGAPPYQVSVEDRIRWAQIADVMAQANHYAQPEPGNGGTRTSFGAYPTLPAHTISVKGTLPLSTMAPPVPLPRLSLPNKAPPLSAYGAFSQQRSIYQRPGALRTSLDTTSSSEEEDRADLLGRNFNAPRPKSRTSIANQSGIYYDVDFERSDPYSKQNTIPMNTYTLNPQHQVRSFFR